MCDPTHDLRQLGRDLIELRLVAPFQRPTQGIIGAMRRQYEAV
jgi:hypothetical protein